MPVFTGVQTEWEYVTDTKTYEQSGFIRTDIPDSYGFDPVSLADVETLVRVITHDCIEHVKGEGDTGIDNEFHALGSICHLRLWNEQARPRVTEKDIASDIQSLYAAFDLVVEADSTVEDLEVMLDEYVTLVDYNINPKIGELVKNWIGGIAYPMESVLGCILYDRIARWMSKGYDESVTRWSAWKGGNDIFGTLRYRIEIALFDFFTQLEEDHGWIDSTDLWQGFGFYLNITADGQVQIEADHNTIAAIAEDDQIHGEA